jgi:hypothetical protein
MIKIDHARILNAYLARLTLADIDAIQAANRTWAYAAMNQNNSSLLECQASFYATVANAVNNLIQHDIAYIEQVISEELHYADYT